MNTKFITVLCLTTLMANVTNAFAGACSKEKLKEAVKEQLEISFKNSLSSEYQDLEIQVEVSPINNKVSGDSVIAEIYDSNFRRVDIVNPYVRSCGNCNFFGVKVMHSGPKQILIYPKISEPLHLGAMMMRRNRVNLSAIQNNIVIGTRSREIKTTDRWGDITSVNCAVTLDGFLAQHNDKIRNGNYITYTYDQVIETSRSNIYYGQNRQPSVRVETVRTRPAQYVEYESYGEDIIVRHLFPLREKIKLHLTNLSTKAELTISGDEIDLGKEIQL